ncbi:MAG: RsmE family RNA methyltransferase [Spirochaetales bacterium]|jgi:RsmE family RNA methyltransferase
MNIVFLKESEIGALIAPNDRRREHIARILKKKTGDFIAAGCSDGTLGQARIESLSQDGLVLSYQPSSQAPSLRPIRLLMGFPRPIQAGRILKDLTSLGIAELWFALSDLGEKSYAESTFFRNKEFENHLIEGAEQAGNPRLPEILSFWTMDRACDALDARELKAGAASPRFMFHPDPSLPRIVDLRDFDPPVTLAIGSERGWTKRELDLMDAHGFKACFLGDRILKTETAALAAVSIVASRLGYM